MKKQPTIVYLKIAVFAMLLLPAVALVLALLTNNLGTNPIEKLTHETGKWSLISLCLSLAATPLKNLFNWKWSMKFRRMLGLFAFFYACFHFAIYWIFDQSLSIRYVWQDISERPYITLGFSAWLILLPLAVTSTNTWRRRLAKHWLRLHRLVYLAVILALMHYIWLIRADYAEVYPYVIATVLMLAYRCKQPAKRFFTQAKTLFERAA